MLKQCRNCHETKSVEGFYPSAGRKCKRCILSASKEKRRTNGDDMRRADRERSKRRQGVITENAKRWRQRHPDRYRAQTAVGNAIRDGRLSRGVCGECGDERVHGHHRDYTRPLEVEWLCPLHHARQH